MELSAPSNSPDVQNYKPDIHVSLSRVGVTGVEKVIRIGQPGAEHSYHAHLECFVDLGPKQKGAHMSRFEEVVNEAIGSSPSKELRCAPSSWLRRSLRASVNAKARAAPR